MVKIKKWILDLFNPYSVEHYPIGRAFYPKYRRRYLVLNQFTGLVEKKKELGAPSNTQAGAIAMIEKFKKQRHKKSKFIIKYEAKKDA